MTAGSLAVAIHDVAPSTLERCRWIRDWLADLGVERATLLVIPAPWEDPFQVAQPDLTEWLVQRREAGDAIAQHGFGHRRVAHGGWLRERVARWQGGESAEFVGMTAEETRCAVDAGRRLMCRVGVEPRGFVAPGYAYTPALRRAVAETFDWWAGVACVHRGRSGRPRLAPALGLGASSPLKRRASPWFLTAGAAVAGSLLRLDVHPCDLRPPRHAGAVERVLQSARRRGCVTYDDLA